MLCQKMLMLTVIIFTLIICSLFFFQVSISYGLPEISDPNLKIDRVIDVRSAPIDMAFIGENDILVAQKNTGQILRIVNGNILSEPLLDLSVATAGEHGLISIAVDRNMSKTFVFTYHVQSGGGEDGDDFHKGIKPLGSFVYRFELVNNKLVNPKQLMYINTTATGTYNKVEHAAHHVGGKIIIGPDKNLYIIVGDGLDHRTKAQNILSGPMPDGTGGVLRITQDGRPVAKPPLGESFPLNLYYAYGIRNSIAMDFDPVSGYLWDAEAGPDSSDELNLVVPGFNSGWNVYMGFSDEVNNQQLVDFDGRGIYMDPKFLWNSPETPTAIKFMNSTKLGSEYENDLFVMGYRLGHSNLATLHHFELNNARTELLLTGQLADKVANTFEEDDNHIFVSNLGIVTDIEVGPDGNLYLLQLTKTAESSTNTSASIPCKGCGAIYKISAVNQNP
jgi:glucose/arabinose dehydrogenase